MYIGFFNVGKLLKYLIFNFKTFYWNTRIFFLKKKFFHAKLGTW